MQSIEQHHYRETEDQTSNGCKLLVKKDVMLDSLDAKERSYDNSTNGVNFTIREVNLMFVFIAVVWIFFLNKYMIQNPLFFVYSAMLSIVYAIVLWANFYVKLLISSAKAAVNSFDECNVFEKAAQLSFIVYDNIHGIRCENKGTTKYSSSAVRRKYRKSNKYRILKMLNQYPHVIKSPKPKQSNAWRSNSVPNVYKNLNHRVNHVSPICLGIQKQTLVLFLILLKQFKLLTVKKMWQCLGLMLLHNV